jgi:hypothetical protein
VIFSVWDVNARVYDYFEAPGTSADYGARGTKYRALRGAPSGPPPGLGGFTAIGPIGFTPDSLAMPLPSNVRQVGRGKDARGVIAVHARGVGDYVAIDNLADYVAVDNLGLAGFGDVGEDPPVPVAVDPGGISFGQVVAASVVASVVGVFVQRALKKHWK